MYALFFWYLLQALLKLGHQLLLHLARLVQHLAGLFGVELHVRLVIGLDGEERVLGLVVDQNRVVQGVLLQTELPASLC